MHTFSNNEGIQAKLNAMRNGDKKAFEELYRDLYVPVYTIIFRIIWDKMLSEDILQEVFVKLFLLAKLPTQNPRAYIFQIARNLAIDYVRKQSQHISIDDVSDAVHQSAPDYSTRMDIDNALKSLQAQECQIVTLHVIGELKFREISELMQIPLGTVLWKYHRAIDKLQKKLSGGSP